MEIPTKTLLFTLPVLGAGLLSIRFCKQSSSPPLQQSTTAEVQQLQLVEESNVAQQQDLPPEASTALGATAQRARCFQFAAQLNRLWADKTRQPILEGAPEPEPQTPQEFLEEHVLEVSQLRDTSGWEIYCALPPGNITPSTSFTPAGAPAARNSIPNPFRVRPIPAASPPSAEAVSAPDPALPVPPLPHQP